MKNEVGNTRKLMNSLLVSLLNTSLIRQGIDDIKVMAVDTDFKYAMTKHLKFKNTIGMVPCETILCHDPNRN